MRTGKRLKPSTDDGRESIRMGEEKLMKKGIVFLMMTLAMLMLSVQFGAAAEIADIHILKASVDRNAPVAYIALRAKDASGKGMKINADALEFEASRSNGDGKSVQLNGSKAGAGSFGHIIVVDTSLYYFESPNIKATHIGGIITAYLNRLSEEERVKFILAGEKGCTEIDYMTLAEAKNYAAQIALGQQDSAMIYTAIYTAYEQAKEPAENAPPYNSIFIVADPNLSTNGDSVQLLEDAVFLYNDSEEKFDVLLAMPYRASYFGKKGASKEKTGKINEGFATYESVASRSGGLFCRVPQNNQGVDTTELDAKVIEQHSSLTLLEVDLSSLNQLLDREGGEQEVVLRVSGKNGNRTSTVHVKVDASLLPPPPPTPTPEGDPPEMPVVVLHQKDSKAFEAIRALIKLWYLEDNSYSEFDGKCWMAYVDFCQANGINASDGIYEDAFNLLMQGGAVPAGTATPEPTATPKATPTPAPTIKPDGYVLGDVDTEENGGFIYSMQVVLQNLNCFGEEKPSSGMMDQPTLDAVSLYCETYGWNNETANNVSAMLVNDIITNGPNREPYVQPELSRKEKMRAFLTAELFHVGSFPVSRGMMLVVAVALIFIATIVMILVSGKKGIDGPDGGSVRGPGGGPGGGSGGGPDGGPTLDVFLPVTLSIAYQETQRTLNTYICLDEDYIIGRDSKNFSYEFNLKLDADDRRVSRPHAALYLVTGPDGKGLYLCDLGSRNGTIVNGNCVKADAQSWSEEEKTNIARGTYDFSKNNEEFMKKLAVFKEKSSRLVHDGDIIEIGSHQIRISL